MLDFGDRSFPAFCGVAKTVAAAAQAKGWHPLLPLDTIDRQSPQDFARWESVSTYVLGIALDLSHPPDLPQTIPLTLVSRRDYGAAVQAPTAILRCALPRVSHWQGLRGAPFARFQAGELIGILPEGGALPRLCSLSSGHRDGFIEIVVKKHPGGLCAGRLTALEPGDTVAVVLRRNPGFRPGRSRAPLIPIGAGTGIGPLAGLLRDNARRRPVHLFFGLRHPDSDFFYGPAHDILEFGGAHTRKSAPIALDLYGIAKG